MALVNPNRAGAFDIVLLTVCWSLATLATAQLWPRTGLDKVGRVYLGDVRVFGRSHDQLRLNFVEPE